MENWLRIQVGNGTEFDSSTITPNLKFLELDTTPTFANNYQTINGVNGAIYNSSQFNQSVVNLKFLVRFENWNDFNLAKHDLYRTFMTKDLIRVRCSTAPNKVYYCRSAAFEIAVSKVGMQGAVFTVPLENPSGMAYSICNSDELQNLEKTGNWSYGMNLLTDTPMIYNFSNMTDFKVYNPSDVPINPYLHDNELNISIHFKGYKYYLTNKTNGSEWHYNNPSDGSDNFLLKGVICEKNGSNDSTNTDFGHIILEKGWNEFTIENANVNDITFSFPFIYSY